MDKKLKRILLLTWLFTLMLACSGNEDNEPGIGGIDPNEPVPAGVDTYGYIKDTDGSPIKGVVVSDGFICVSTDENGLYKFNRSKEARHVSYSLPSGYAVEINSATKLPLLYSKLQPKKDKYNFTLKKLSAPETRFNLITIGDPQVTNAEQIERFRTEVVADVNKYTSTATVPCYAITLGDLVGNKWNLYTNLATVMRSDIIGVPLFNVIGNHDHDLSQNTEASALSEFERTFGPSNYSFNRGNVHIVAMNNILCDFATSSEYTGGFTKERFEWLKQDLSYVPKDKMIILCMHVPFRHGNMPYADEILDLLSEYKSVSIMSGHTHSNYKYIHEIKGKEIVEHITGTACGAWWASTVCTEGSPIGFGIFQIDGTEIKDWTYKAVKHDENYQIRLYRASDVFTGGGSASYKYKYTASNQIIANIWNWDPKWTVNVYEDGVKTGEMIRFTGKDAWSGAYHVGVLARSSSYYKDTDHLFYYTLKDSNAKVKVEAIDRFGKKFEQTEFTGATSSAGLPY